jgi:hypothetical protein
VLVFQESRAANRKSFTYSNADFLDLRAGTEAIFDDLAGVASFRAFVPRDDGSSEQVGKALVTANFFRLMGAGIALGRDFTEADAVPQPSQPEVLIPPGSAAILSYEYWQHRYAGSPTVLGREISGSGQSGPRIVGVLAPGFKLFLPGVSVDAAPDFWVANNIGYDAAHRNLLTAGAIGRLKSGATLATPAGIFKLVVGHGLSLTAAGLALGLPAAFAVTRTMDSVLVGVEATDPSTFAAMSVLSFLVAAVASWVPAARAAGLDVNSALREE